MGTSGACWDTLPISASGAPAKSHSLWFSQKCSSAYISHCTELVFGHYEGNHGSTQPRLPRSGWLSPPFQVWSRDLLHADHRWDHPPLLQSSIPFTQAIRGTTRNSFDLLDPSYPCILVFLVRNTPVPHSLCYGLHCTPQDVRFQSNPQYLRMLPYLEIMVFADMVKLR